MRAYSQEITVGPVTVDTGDDWLDFGMVVALLILLCALGIIHKKWTKEK